MTIEHGLDLDLRGRPGNGSFQLSVDARWRWRGVLGLVGPSGTGKSTLLRAIAGLQPEILGDICFDGDRMQCLGRSLPAHRRRIACVFQDSRLFPHLDVAGNLRYALRRAPAGVTGPGYDRVLGLLGLSPLLSRRVAGLSGGETQRVALARALLAAPRLLLLDEPISALDTDWRHEILQAIRNIRDRLGLPMIYVTHNLDELKVLEATVTSLQRIGDHSQLRIDSPLVAAMS